MPCTLYLIRHAQSHPQADVEHPEWPLSAVGRDQAQKLVEPLSALGIERVFSSPFRRCRETIAPFADHRGLASVIVDDLRERLVALELVDGFEQLWRRSWEDFNYALPGCETSTACQHRIRATVSIIARANPGQTLAISSHGNAIGLLLNALDPQFGRENTESIRNPDVLRLQYRESDLTWDRDFAMQALDEWATDHSQTPVTRGRKRPDQAKEAP